MKANSKAQLNVRIDSALARRARIVAAVRGWTIGEVVQRALEGYLPSPGSRLHKHHEAWVPRPRPGTFGERLITGGRRPKKKGAP